MIKNVICQGRTFPGRHPKDPAIFRNCLFRRCTIKIECWCGPVLHGCRFEECTFVYGNIHIEPRNKRCEITGNTRILHAPDFDRRRAGVLVRHYFGQERCVESADFGHIVDEKKKS